MLDFNKIDEVVVANNLKVEKTAKIEEVNFTDFKSGEVTTYKYQVLPWLVTKTKGRNNFYFSLALVLKNALGRSLTLTINLSDEDVQQINYFKGNFFDSLTPNVSNKVYVKTQFSYGLNKNDNPYVLVRIIIADKVVKSLFLPYSYTRIFFDAMSDEEKCFNIILDKKLNLDEESISEIEIL